MTVFASVVGVGLAITVVKLWQLDASPLLIFMIPSLLASMAVSLAMAAHWREWRALPLSLVFGLLAARGVMDTLVHAGVIPADMTSELIREALLWSSAPVAFAAIGGLWRIFENHTLFNRRQREMLEHESRYRYMIENAMDAFYSADASGKFTLVNASVARLLGRRLEDLTGTSVFDLIGEDAANTIREAIDLVKTKDVKSYYHEFPIHRRDGSERWIGQNLQAVVEGRQLRGFQAVLRDITDLHRAQEALRQNESRLRMLFETMSEGVIQTRADGHIVFANPAAVRILGVTRQDIEGRHCADPVWEFVRANGTPMPVEEWVGFRALKEKQPVPRLVTGIRRPDNAIRWLSAKAETIAGSENSLGGVVITFNDISESKAAAENLEVIDFALDNAVEQVFLATREGRLVYANKSALRALGHPADAILSKTIFDIAPDVLPADWAETWRKAKAGEWPTFECSYVTSSGKTYPASTSVNHVEFNAREYLFAFARDISRETELAMQLRHAQKMEAIGILAGGIAHDFNNILSGVLGYTELAMQDTPKDGTVHSFLTEIQAGGRRAADLVQQILTFSRRGEQKHQPLCVAPVVKEALKLLRGSLPSTIRIREEIEARCGLVIGDPVQIHQVIMNLSTNAFHAMRDTGGVLTVGLREVDIGPGWISGEFHLEPGKYVQLSVADTGCGMDASTRQRIFEPFFTTKKLGEGTGLGLATVHGIVKGHKGGIRLESAPGKGTRFDILFPLSKTTPRIPAPADEPEGSYAGSETILFVDDEEAIRESMSTGFRRLGYTVETATDGRQALALFQSSPDRFGLVIGDQIMPHPTGLEMSRIMLKVRPGLPIILCTGYPDVISRDEACAAGVKELVLKPFEFHQLAKTARRVLDQTRGAPP